MSAQRIVWSSVVGWSVAFLILSSASASQRAATPTISPAGGTFTNAVTVTLATDTAGATIKYRIDGGEILIYSDPFPLTQTATVEAKAVKSGYQPSLIATASFTINQNQPPTVDAGADQTLGWHIMTLLAGSASDPDGDLLTLTWSELSGPVNGMPIVTFSDPSSATTSALFPIDGTYILKLTADDGASQAFDDVTITVPKAYIMGQIMDEEDIDLAHVEEFVEELDTIKSEFGTHAFAQTFPESGDYEADPDNPPGTTPEQVWEAYLDAVAAAGVKLRVWFDDEPPTCTGLCDSLPGEGDWDLRINGQFLEFLTQYEQTHGTSPVNVFFLIDEPYHEDKHDGDVTPEQLQRLYSQAKALAPPDVLLRVNFSGEIMLGELYNNQEDYVVNTCESCGVSALEFQDKDDGGGAYFHVEDLVNNHCISRFVIEREAAEAGLPVPQMISSAQVFGVNPAVGGYYYMPSAEELDTLLTMLQDPSQLGCAPEWTPVRELDGIGFQNWHGSVYSLKDPEFAAQQAVVKKAMTGQDAPTVHACPLAERDADGLCEDRTLNATNEVTALDGEVIDDGLPSPPGTLTTTWSLVSVTGTDGGTVTFGDPSAVDTTATFDLGRTYTLRLTATDGLLFTSDDIAIIVPKDVTDPTVAITNLVGGQTVSGIVDVEADAGDNVGVTNAEFYVDGELQAATNGSPPYSFAWNTTSLVDGQGYTLRVQVYDLEGNGANSVVWVQVSNDVPSVWITNPTDNAIVKADADGTTFSVRTEDSGDIQQVNFYVDDGNTFSTTVQNPDTDYVAITWPTAGLAQGSSHTLTADVIDDTGKTAAAAPITVTIKDELPPTNVAIIWPADDSTVSGVVLVQATATDNVAVDRVTLLIDGVEQPDIVDHTAPYELSFATIGRPEGEDYNLKARAYDTSERQTTSDLVRVIVRNDITPPDVDITFPLDGLSYSRSGPLVITADATDLIGVTRVEFFVDTIWKCTEYNLPYTCNWTGRTAGPHTIQTTAYDEAGNVDSDQISVTIN